MNFQLRAFARQNKNVENSFRKRVSRCSMCRTLSGSAPVRPGCVSGLARGRFWTTPSRSKLALGAPRSALGRLLGVSEPSRARPQNGFERPELPQIDFSTMFCRFWLIVHRFLIDFSWIFARSSYDFRAVSSASSLLAGGPPPHSLHANAFHVRSSNSHLVT